MTRPNTKTFNCAPRIRRHMRRGKSTDALTLWKRYLAIAAIWLAGNLPGSAGADQLSLRPVYVSTNFVPAPGEPTGGYLDNFFGARGINAGGHLAFAGELETTSSADRGVGFWAFDGTNIVRIARENWAAPGVPGATLQLLSPGQYVIDDQNRILMKGRLGVGSGGVTLANREAIWLGPVGGLQPIVRAGTTAPGTTGAFLEFDFPNMNADGDIVFSSTLATGQGGVVAGNDSGIWRRLDNTLGLIAREGSAAPGAGGRTYTELSQNQPHMDRHGHLAFKAALNDGRVGFWTDNSGTLGLIGAEGQGMNGLPAGARIGIDRGLQSDFSYSLSGRLGFRVRMEENFGGVTSANWMAIMIGDGATNSMVARQGNTAPGLPSHMRFDEGFGVPAVNDGNLVAFKASFVSTNTPSVGRVGAAIWAGQPGNLMPIIREGDRAPGTPNGAVFGNLNSTTPRIDNEGRIYLDIRLEGLDTTSVGSNSLWVFDPQDGLRLVGYRGQSIEVAPGVFRTIDRVASSIGDSRITSDAGEMFVAMQYEDDSIGVFLANLAAPAPPPARVIGYTNFDEPAANAPTYAPGPGAQELGFTTGFTPNAGDSPFAGVVRASPNSGLLRHRSGTATTSFVPVDLSPWSAVEVSLSIVVAHGTAYEAGDLIRARVTNGAETIQLIEMLGSAAQADPLDIESALDMRRVYSAYIPDHWQSAQLIVTSTSNSTQAAEYYDIDEVRFVGVPEPPAIMVGLVGLFGCFIVRLRNSRRERRKHLTAA
jgi:hypothetical protein